MYAKKYDIIVCLYWVQNYNDCLLLPNSIQTSFTLTWILRSVPFQTPLPDNENRIYINLINLIFGRPTWEQPQHAIINQYMEFGILVQIHTPMLIHYIPTPVTSPVLSFRRLYKTTHS